MILFTLFEISICMLQSCLLRCVSEMDASIYLLSKQ